MCTVALQATYGVMACKYGNMSPIAEQGTESSVLASALRTYRVHSVQTLQSVLFTNILGKSKTVVH